METLEPSQANFIAQADFVRFLQEFPDVGLKVAKQLTHNCKCAYDEIRSLGLSNSVPEKLAKLILRWAEHPLELSAKKPNETAITCNAHAGRNCPIHRHLAGDGFAGAYRFPQERLSQGKGSHLDNHQPTRVGKSGDHLTRHKLR